MGARLERDLRAGVLRLVPKLTGSTTIALPPLKPAHHLAEQ
jgi:hypothetical protein